MLKAAGLALATALALSAPARSGEDRTFYPPDVYAMSYSGWAESSLKQLGEKPFWHGVEDQALAQQMRFVFSDGHPMKTRILHLRQSQDGTGKLHVFSISQGDKQPRRVERRDEIPLDAAQVAEINALVSASGTFNFPAGSWDDADDIYTHCQLLEMERINAEGYRYLSVNIGCNQPKKLVPLIEHLMALAGIKRRDPQLF